MHRAVPAKKQQVPDSTPKGFALCDFTHVIISTAAVINFFGPFDAIVLVQTTFSGII